MAEIITIPDLENGKVDIDTLADIVNLQEPTTETRLSGPVNTWFGVQSQITSSTGLVYTSKALMDAAPGTVTGQAARVTEGADAGFYIWSGSAWVKTNDPLEVYFEAARKNGYFILGGIDHQYFKPSSSGGGSWVVTHGPLSIFMGSGSKRGVVQIAAQTDLEIPLNMAYTIDLTGVEPAATITGTVTSTDFAGSSQGEGTFIDDQKIILFAYRSNGIGGALVDSVQDDSTNWSAKSPIWFTTGGGAVKWDSLTRTLSWAGGIACPMAAYGGARRLLVLNPYSVTFPTTNNYQVVWLDLRKISKASGDANYDPASVIKVGSYTTATTDFENSFMGAAYQLPLFFYGPYGASSAPGFFNGFIDGAEYNAPQFNPFEPSAPVLNQTFIAKDFIQSMELWGVPVTETVDLFTVWNYWLNPTSQVYSASIGFRSSAGYHITTSLAPQTNIALFAVWNITQKLTGIVEYLLYKNGIAGTPPIGRVVIDWDKVTNTTSQRYFSTTPSSFVNRSSVDMPDFPSMAPDSGRASWWAGKKIAGIGDSNMWGFIPRNSPGAETQQDSWLVHVGRNLGMVVQNNGISGSTLAVLDGGGGNPMVNRYTALANDADIVVVCGGTNDVRQGVPLGTMTDTAYPTNTYYGALHTICLGLINKYWINQGLPAGQGKKIVLCTPIKLLNTDGTLNVDLEPYAQAVREVAAYYSLPVFDFYNESGLNPHILQTVQGTAPGYTGMYNPEMTDGTHVVQSGHIKWNYVACGMIESLAPQFADTI